MVLTPAAHAQEAAPPSSPQQTPAEPYVLVTEKLWLEAIELIKLQQQLIQHLRKRAEEKMRCS